MQPLVSIVIPNHNYAQFVGAAIDSALGQTWEALEVIVLDDGSTDGSRQVIEGYGNRIRAIFKRNEGQMATNNAGFLVARGEVVLFLDADDLLRPEAVATVMASFRPGVSAVQFCLATIDQDGKSLGGVYPPLPREWSPARVRQTLLASGFYPFPPTSGNAYARWFLDKVMPLPPARFPSGTDGILNAVAPLYGDVVVLREPLACYRIHGGNMGALASLAPEKFSYYVRLDRSRAGFLAEHAWRLGIPVPSDTLDRAFFHLQYRLASRKLRPELHPYKNDRLGRIAWLLARAAWHAPEPPLTRALVAIWGLAVALSPQRWAEALVALRFVPGRRPAVIDRILALFGLVRRAKPLAKRPQPALAAIRQIPR